MWTKGVNKLYIADFTLFMINGSFDFSKSICKLKKYVRKVFNYKFKYIQFHNYKYKYKYN